MSKVGGERKRTRRAAEDGTRASPRRDVLEREIYLHAARLFAERGVGATSLQDIAESVGMSRPALYHYFSSKDDLLSRLIAEHPKRSARELAAIRRRKDIGPAQKLREMVRALVMVIAEDPVRFRTLVTSEGQLTGELAAMHAKAKRTVLKEMQGVIEEGIDVGAFRHADARVSALGVLGMGNWSAWWLNADDPNSTAAIAEELSQMAVLAVSRTGAAPLEQGIPAAIRAIREDLDHLERQFSG